MSRYDSRYEHRIHYETNFLRLSSYLFSLAFFILFLIAFIITSIRRVLAAGRAIFAGGRCAITRGKKKKKLFHPRGSIFQPKYNFLLRYIISNFFGRATVGKHRIMDSERIIRRARVQQPRVKAGTGKYLFRALCRPAERQKMILGIGRCATTKLSVQMFEKHYLDTVRRAEGKKLAAIERNRTREFCNEATKSAHRDLSYEKKRKDDLEVAKIFHSRFICTNFNEKYSLFRYRDLCPDNRFNS